MTHFYYNIVARYLFKNSPGASMTHANALHVKNLITMKAVLYFLKCLIWAIAIITMYVIGLYIHLCFI